VNPTAVEYAKRGGIVMHIRSSFSSLPGTIVKEDDGMQIAADVRGVAHDTNVTKLALVGVPDQPGIAYRVFDGLSKAHINVDMIVQSQKDERTNDILFTVAREDADTARGISQQIADDLKAKGVTRDDRVAKVSIVGAGMANNSGVAARMFGALARRNINIEVISTSEIRVSCLIPATKVEDAVRAIHHEFGL
jgi:aspartate kinase